MNISALAKSWNSYSWPHCKYLSINCELKKLGILGKLVPIKKFHHEMFAQKMVQTMVGTEVVLVLSNLSYMQVNIRAQQRAKFRQITEKKQTTKEETEEQTAFFDPRVTLTNAQRSKRQFKFNEAGMHTLT